MSEDFSEASATCNICNANQYLYVCPRCSICYCSVACYRDTKHLNCSESFYKEQILDSVSAQSEDESAEGRRKMQEILMRLHAGDSVTSQNLDSDDDDGGDEEVEESEDELSSRLAGVNLDDADAVWQRLTVSERSEFEKLLQTGGITELLPKYSPWWTKKTPLIEEIHPVSGQDALNDKALSVSERVSDTLEKKVSSIPLVLRDVPNFKTLCKKTVSPCLAFNCVNIVGSYVYTVRCFNGEHLEWPSQAAYIAWNLSVTLNNNQNFENMLDAVSSIAVNMTEKENSSEEDITTMKRDAKCILSSAPCMQAAFSDLLSLFCAALKHRPPTAKGPFSQRFPDGADNQLPRDKLKLTVKKIEFYLSWVLHESFCFPVIGHSDSPFQ